VDGVDGVDDLGAVDALQVDRGDLEVRVSELAPDVDRTSAGGDVAFRRCRSETGVGRAVRGAPAARRLADTMRTPDLRTTAGEPDIHDPGTLPAGPVIGSGLRL
jgi:hypothetical protein